MVNKELISYIKSALSKGILLEQIKQNLLAQGWSDYDINEAINLAQKTTIPESSSIAYSPSKKTSKKYKFLIILGIIIILIAGGLAFFILNNKQIESQKNCTLKSSFNKIDLLEGASLGFSVSGFQGNAKDISWSSTNTTIAIVSQSKGSSVDIEAKNKGITRILIVDNAVGPDCTISLQVNVTSVVEKSSGDECTTDISCTDGDVTTKDICSGTPKKCSHIKITNCFTGDNYCPPNCNYNNDRDCEQQIENIIDCGSNIVSEGAGNMPNFDCFINASKTCKPAKLTNTITTNILGMINTATSFMEIKGIEGSKCLYYTKTLNSDVTFSDELIQQMLNANSTQEQISQQEQTANESAQGSVGKDSTCKYPIEDLVKMLNDTEQGSFSYSSEDVTKYECTGSMYNN